MEELEPLLDVMRRISEKRDVPISAVGLNWILCKGVIPLPGARNAKQAEQNAKCCGWRLTEEEIAELEQHSKEGSLSFWQKG
jgi:aryl-alcohol dehydrogenase-like predicted oxidoreductase